MQVLVSMENAFAILGSKAPTVKRLNVNTNASMTVYAEPILLEKQFVNAKLGLEVLIVL
jgi:hypothetical protein